MNFTKTYSLSNTMKSIKQNQNCQNQFLCQCNCCACCCSCCACCCCHCNCSCHIESRKQTEENNNNIKQRNLYDNNTYEKLNNRIKKNYQNSNSDLQNNDLINSNLMKRRIKSCQSYINMPVKYANRKISDDVENFNKQLVSYKIKLKEQKSIRPSISNTTNDNSLNTSAINYPNCYSPYSKGKNNYLDNDYDNHNNPNNSYYQSYQDKNKQDFYNFLNSINSNSKGELSPFGKDKQFQISQISNNIKDINNDFSYSNPRNKKNNEFDKSLIRNKSFINNSNIKNPTNIRTTYAYTGKMSKENNNNIQINDFDNNFYNISRDFHSNSDYLNNTDNINLSNNKSNHNHNNNYQRTSYDNQIQNEKKYIPSNQIDENKSFVNLLKDKSTKFAINQKKKIINPRTNNLNYNLGKNYFYEKVDYNKLEYRNSKLSIQYFRFNIIGENYQLDNSKDLIINELKKQVLYLNDKLKSTGKEYSFVSNSENQNDDTSINRNNYIIQEQKEEIEKLKNELIKVYID